jgi:hypothetical protein
MSVAQQLAEGIAEIAGDYVRSEISVRLESNALPAVTIYSGSEQATAGGGLGLASKLGIRGGVVVRNKAGKVLAKFGNPAAFDPLRAALVVGGASLAVWLVWRALR